MKYRAFANGQEITEFPINGGNTDEIWGGDTLLWKKEQQGRELRVTFFSLILQVHSIPPLG